MTGSTLDARTRLSIELALTAHCGNTQLIAQQDTSARTLGLTGAEIDAARRNWSFDLRTSVAMALAVAANEPERCRQRARAVKVGLTGEACREIEDLALRLAPAPSATIPAPAR